MVSQETTHLDIEPALVGTLHLEGLQVPHVNLKDDPFVHTRLRIGETEYTYDRSFPIVGHSAVMPAALAGLLEEDRLVLVAERNDRYYVYVA